MGKTYTGVAIGNESLKLAVCDGSAVKALLVEDLPEGLMADGRVVSFDAMADLIKRAMRHIRGASKDAAFVMPKADTYVRHVVVPAMNEKQLLLNLPYEFRDYIAQGKDRYSYDYAVLRTALKVDGTPESMDLLAVASLKETVADYEDMFHRAGLRLRIAMPSQAAYQNLVGGNPRALANCCIINFSHTAAKLHFFTDGAYEVTRIIDTGGQDIDRAIADAYGVDIHVATGYKHANYEGAQTIPAAMAVYETVAVEIGRALNFYAFNNPDTPIEVVYFGGGGSLLQPLMDTVASRIDVELRSIVDIMPPLQAGEDLRALCASAVGATLGGR